MKRNRQVEWEEGSWRWPLVFTIIALIGMGVVVWYVGM